MTDFQAADEVYITSGQAAHLLKISATSVRRMVRDGRLQPQLQTAGGHIRFRLSYVHRIARRWRGQAEQSDPIDPAAGWWTGPVAGQSLIEFALVLPALLLVVLGFLAIGFSLWQLNAMNNAADSGAFYASLGHDAEAVETHIRQRLREQAVDPDPISVGLTPPNYTYGDAITVALTKTMRLNAIWWEQTFDMSTCSTQIVQKQVTP